MINNLTAIMIQKEVDQRDRIGSDKHYVYKNDRVYTYGINDDNFTFKSFGDQLKTKPKSRPTRSSKIRVLEEKIRGLETTLANSSALSWELRFIIVMLMCWALYTIVTLLLVLQRWLSRKRSEASLSQMVSPIPDSRRPQQQHLSKVFKSFVVERCLSNTKDDADEKE